MFDPLLQNKGISNETLIAVSAEKYINVILKQQQNMDMFKTIR